MKTLERNRPTLMGYAWMAVAVSIWASWLVLTSSGRTTSLSIVDLALFRALIPTLLLAPLLWHGRHELVRVGPVPCLILSAYGAPFMLCVGLGLSYAPVAHAGAMVPGLMPVFALALGWLFLDQQPQRLQLVATLFIVVGAAVFLFRGSGEQASDQEWIGHLLFLLGSFCWASFTVTIRTIAVPPFLATGVVGAISTVALLPVWMMTDLSNLNGSHAYDIAFQAVFQGFISGFLSMFAFGRALQLIPGQATILSALTPGVATALAIPVLGQMPDMLDILAMAIVILGLAANSLGAGSPNIETSAGKRHPSARSRILTSDRSTI